MIGRSVRHMISVAVISPGAVKTNCKCRACTRRRPCCLEDIRRENPYHTDMVDEILEILTDTCCNSRPVIRIGGEDKPAQIVKSKLMKLNGEHIRYVLMCFLENTTKVRNIKQYLLAALYNAPMTIGSYYTALVRHDMYGTD